MTSLLFPNYHFTTELLYDLALVYANTKGPPDLRLGGYQEVLWRQFVIDIRKVPLPETHTAHPAFNPDLAADEFE